MNAAEPRTDEPRLSPREQRRMRLWRGTLFAIAGVALFPGLVQFVRGETARWYLARGYEADLDGEPERATQLLDRALQLNPSDPFAKQYRASKMVRVGQASQALADAEQALKIARARFERMPNINTRQALAGALNNAAYFSGLADVDLETALQRIEEAFTLTGDPNDSTMLDTRGYILWRLERYEDAIADVDRAVEKYKHEYLAFRRQIERQGTYIVDARRLSYSLSEVDYHMAVLYYHRALVNQGLGEAEKAERDFKRVVNLGFDPQAGLF